MDRSSCLHAVSQATDSSRGLGSVVQRPFLILSKWVKLNSDDQGYGKQDLTGHYRSCHLITLDEYEEDIKIMPFHYKCWSSGLMWLSQEGQGKGKGRGHGCLSLFLLKMIYPTGSHWQKNWRQKTLSCWSQFWRIWLGLGCSAGFSSIFAKGPAMMINVICLNHYSAPWFGKH